MLAPPAGGCFACRRRVALVHGGLSLWQVSLWLASSPAGVSLRWCQFMVAQFACGWRVHLWAVIFAVSSVRSGAAYSQRVQQSVCGVVISRWPSSPAVGGFTVALVHCGPVRLRAAGLRWRLFAVVLAAGVTGSVHLRVSSVHGGIGSQCRLLSSSSDGISSWWCRLRLAPAQFACGWRQLSFPAGGWSTVVPQFDCGWLVCDGAGCNA